MVVGKGYVLFLSLDACVCVCLCVCVCVYASVDEKSEEETRHRTSGYFTVDFGWRRTHMTAFDSTWFEQKNEALCPIVKQHSPIQNRTNTRVKTFLALSKATLQ